MTNYRFLQEGEIIQEDDEFYCLDGYWALTSNTGDEVDSGGYRRKVESKPRSQAYYILEPGEIIQEGDEFYCYDGYWALTSNTGQKVGDGCYRRKIEQ
jgi:hypothetical protein